MIRLTKFTIISLRVLVLLSEATKKKTAEEICVSLGVSKDHLTKVIHFMNKENWIETSRGKGGGVKLILGTMDIPLNIIIEKTERFVRTVDQIKWMPCTKESLIMKEIEKAQILFYENLCMKSINSIIKTDYL